jgi:hypothetical protein
MVTSSMTAGEVPAVLGVTGQPPHVQSWSVAGIQGFVPAVLRRWVREYGPLPEHFCMVMCPQAEVSARGGLPPGVHELTDPRLRCRHFTGCHRPYLVLLLMGEDADARRAALQALLPWSEGYRVEIGESSVDLSFVEAREDDATDAPPREGGGLQDLLRSGELVRILA